MAQIEIADFEITQRMLDHIDFCNITVAHLYSVLDRSWIVGRNRGQRVATYILYGTDYTGRCLAIPVVPTDDPYVWRPITAWRCKPHEAAILRRGRS